MKKSIFSFCALISLYSFARAAEIKPIFLGQTYPSGRVYLLADQPKDQNAKTLFMSPVFDLKNKNIKNNTEITFKEPYTSKKFIPEVESMPYGDKTKPCLDDFKPNKDFLYLGSPLRVDLFDRPIPDFCPEVHQPLIYESKIKNNFSYTVVALAEKPQSFDYRVFGKARKPTAQDEQKSKEMIETYKKEWSKLAEAEYSEEQDIIGLTGTILDAKLWTRIELNRTQTVEVYTWQEHTPTQHGFECFGLDLIEKKVVIQSESFCLPKGSLG